MFHAVEHALERIQFLASNSFSSLPLVLASSSDSSSDEACPPRNSRLPNKNRRRALYDRLLQDDYWAPNPVFGPSGFRDLYRMPITIFDEILAAVVNDDDYFRQKRDCTNFLGLLPQQKICTSIRILSSGCSANEVKDRYRMKTTALECLKRFCRSIDRIYCQTALRSPTKADIDQLLEENLQRGFPGCLRSLDCMHWRWKNCPSAWQGQFSSGKEEVPTIILEAIADKSCRFWHFFSEHQDP